MDNQPYFNYLDSGTSFLEDLTNDEVENRNSYFVSSGQENQLYQNNSMNPHMYNNPHLPHQSHPIQSHPYYSNNNPQSMHQQMGKSNQPMFRANSNPMASDLPPPANYNQHYSHPNSDLYRMPLSEPGMYPNNSGFFDQPRQQSSRTYQQAPSSTAQHPSPNFSMQQIGNNSSVPSHYHMQQQSSAMSPQQHSNYMQQQQQQQQQQQLNQYHNLGNASSDNYGISSNSSHHQMHPTPQQLPGQSQTMMRPYPSNTPNHQQVGQNYCATHPSQSMMQPSPTMKQPRPYPSQPITRTNQMSMIAEVDIYVSKIRHLEERLHHLYQTRGQSPGVQQDMLDIQEQIRSLKATREKEILLKQRHRMPTDSPHINQPMTSPSVPVSISPKSNNQYHPTHPSSSPMMDMQNNQAFNNSSSHHLQSPLHHLTQMTMNPVSISSNEFSYTNIPPASSSAQHPFVTTNVDHSVSVGQNPPFTSMHGKPYSTIQPPNQSHPSQYQQQISSNSMSQLSPQVNNYSYPTSEPSTLPNMAELASPLLSGGASRMETLQKSQQESSYNHDPYSADLIRQDELLTPPNLDIRMSSAALNQENNQRHNDFNSTNLSSILDSKTVQTQANTNLMHTSSHQYSTNYASSAPSTSQSHATSQSHNYKSSGSSHSSRSPRTHRADLNQPKLPMNSLDKIIDQVVGRSDKNTPQSNATSQLKPNINNQTASIVPVFESGNVERFSESSLLARDTFVPESESYSNDFPILSDPQDIDIPELSFESSIPDTDQKALQINCDASEDLPSVLVTPPALEPQVNLDVYPESSSNFFIDTIDDDVIDVVNNLLSHVESQCTLAECFTERHENETTAAIINAPMEQVAYCEPQNEIMQSAFNSEPTAIETNNSSLDNECLDDSLIVSKDLPDEFDQDNNNFTDDFMASTPLDWESNVDELKELQDPEIQRGTGEVQQDNDEMQQDNEEVQQDNEEIQQDNEEIQQDNKEEQQDTTEIQQDTTEIQQDNEEIQQDNKEVNYDYDEIQQNTEEVQDNEEMQQDNEEVRRDNEGLEQDTENVLQDKEEIQHDSGEVRQYNEEIRQDTEEMQQDTEEYIQLSNSLDHCESECNNVENLSKDQMQCESISDDEEKEPKLKSHDEAVSQPLTITLPEKTSSSQHVSSTPYSSPAPPPLEVESAYSSTDSVPLASTGGMDSPAMQVCTTSNVADKSDMAIPVLDPPYQSIGVFSPELLPLNEKLEQRDENSDVCKKITSISMTSPPVLHTLERQCGSESDLAREPPRLEEQIPHCSPMPDDPAEEETEPILSQIDLENNIEEKSVTMEADQPSLVTAATSQTTAAKDDLAGRLEEDLQQPDAASDSEVSLNHRKLPGRKRKKISLVANETTCNNSTNVENSTEPMKKRRIAPKDFDELKLEEDLIANDKLESISEVSRDSELTDTHSGRKRRVGRPPKSKTNNKSTDSMSKSLSEQETADTANESDDKANSKRSHAKKSESSDLTAMSSTSGKKRGRPSSTRTRKASDSNESSSEDQPPRSPDARPSKPRPERFKTTRKVEKNQYFESDGDDGNEKRKVEEAESESEQDESETKIVEKILCWRTFRQKSNEDNSNPPFSTDNKSSESVDNCQELESQIEEEYYLKYKGFSYLHCEWKTLAEITDPRISTKLKRFKLKDPKDKSLEDDEEDLFNPDYVEVDRVLDMRTSENTDSGDENEEENKIVEYLVKWKSMAYEDATWELAENVDPNKVKEFLNWRDPPGSIEECRRTKRPNSKQWKKIETATPCKNGNILRDYQLEGVNWLTFCWYQHRNCILADEMGLGKTVQSIAFIMEAVKENIIGPFLVIVPLSTVGNWQREFENWSDLNVIVYHGSAVSRKIIQKYEIHYRNQPDVNHRKQKRGRAPASSNKIYKFHAMITTYEMLMSDLDFFVKIHWRIAIIDEAHRLKNKKCKLGEGLRDLQLDHRILLTGTPLQNNVEELFSLLNFLEPEAFPSAETFLEQYGNLKSEEQVDNLKSLLKPMMLRRLKDDVEKSIAPKEETIIEVELTNMQKKYYRAILERNFTFLSKGSNSSSNVPNLMNTMMELRKCCNHPFLIKGAEDHILSDMRLECQNRLVDEEDLQFRALVYASGKLVLIHKLLPKLKSGGHKVLIFSQMVKVLDILEDYLIHQKYLYERIDGGIHGLIRQEAIDRFSNDPDKFVFLLCTKAGGIGINLTAADVVIIYDSDWNPQNDLQAQARCHRIGQQKMVNVYRLITRNSYEREMFDRASLKLGLDKAVLQSTGSTAKDTKQPQLSKTEIEELLKKGAYGALMDDDKAGEEFCEEDIDKILQSRSHVVKLDTGETNSTFSKASFTTQDTRTDIDIDDPNFWQKWAKKAGVNEDTVENSSLIMEEPRQRRQTNRYTAAEGGAHISELEESAGPDESGEEELGIAGGSSALDRSSRKGKRGKKMGRRSKDSDPIDRTDLFRVEKLLLCWGWGRWEFSLSHSTFKKALTASQLEVLARTILTLALHFYNGDPRIKSFIGDLLRPDSEGVDIRRHSGLSTPVCRGRGYRRMGGHSFSNTTNSESPSEADNALSGRKSVTRSLIADSLSESQMKELDSIDPENVLFCDSFKKHVQRASNKLLHRIQMLYFLEHEVLNPWDVTTVTNIPQLKPPRPGSIDFAELLPAVWWDSEADVCLLKGVHKHGFENYTAIRADPELCFLIKCGPPQETDEEDPEKTLQAICEDDLPTSTETKTSEQNIEKEAVVAENSVTLALNKDAPSSGETKPLEEATPTSLMPFPSSSELNGRFRKLIAYFQRIRHQERFESARRKRVSSDADNEDVSSNGVTSKWSRREETEFYRIVSSFGVEWDTATQGYNWKRFRQLGNLSRKSDQSLNDYYEDFMKMCRLASNQPVTSTTTDVGTAAQSDHTQITILPISEERASRCLSKIALLSRIRNDILPHPHLEERLKLLKKSSDLPDWWQPLEHDKELLIGAAKHGIARMDYSLLRDKDLSFFHMAAAIRKRLTKVTKERSPCETNEDSKPVLKLESTQDDEESILPKTEGDTQSERSPHQEKEDEKAVDLPVESASPITKEEVDNPPQSERKTADIEGEPASEEKMECEPDCQQETDPQESSQKELPTSSDNTVIVKEVDPAESTDATVVDKNLDSVEKQSVAEENADSKQPQLSAELPELISSNNETFSWPKDRVLLHRLDVICKCVETGDASNNDSLPSQTAVNQGSVDSNGSTLASTYDALLAAAGSSRSSSPTSVNNQRQLSTPKPSNQNSTSSACHLPGLESTLARAATLGFSPSKMSSARSLANSSGNSRGRGRGRKRVTDTRTNLFPTADTGGGRSGAAGVNSMMDTQAALQQLMYASAGFDMSTPMGQELIKHLIASSSLDPVAFNQQLASGSSTTSVTTQEESSSTGKYIKNRKRKFMEAEPQMDSPSTTDSKMLKKGVNSSSSKDIKDDASSKFFNPSLSTSENASVMSSLLSGMGSSSLSLGGGTTSLLHSMTGLSDEAGEVQVPLINLRDGTLIYGDDAPRRKSLAKFLQENSDYMPYSVEKEDQMIFATVAKSRGQDTSPMDALVYNHYLTVLQTSAAAAAASSPYSSATVNPAASMLGMSASSSHQSTGLADYYSAAYAAAAGIPGFPPDALTAYAAALASGSGSTGAVTNGVPGLAVSAANRSADTDNELIRTVVSKTPENVISKPSPAKEKPSRPSSSYAPPSMSKTSRQQSRSSTPKQSDNPRISSSVTPVDSSASANLTMSNSNYLNSMGLANFATTSSQSSFEEQQQAALLSYAAMYNPGFLYQQMMGAGAAPQPGLDYSSYLAAAFASQQAQALAAASSNGLYSGSAALAAAAAGMSGSSVGAAGLGVGSGEEFLASLMASQQQQYDKSRYVSHRAHPPVSSASKESDRSASSSKFIPTSSPGPASLLSGMNFPSMDSANSLAGGSGLYSTGASSSNVDSMTAAALQNDTLMKSYMTAYLQQQQQQQLMQYPPPQATRNLIGADAYDLGMLANSAILPPTSTTESFLSATKVDAQRSDFPSTDLSSDLRAFRTDNDDSALDLTKK